MKIKVERIILALSILFWPLSLFLANTPEDFLKYLIPAFLIGLSFFLLEKKKDFYQLPILFIPLFEPKFAASPLIMFAIFFLWRRGKKYLILIIISVFILIFTWKNFWGQTIFQPDYEARQEILRKSNLYPSVFLARVFQNKPRVYLNKFNDNLVSIIDPNNYFFNFHPREIKIDNQNLNKYPFLSIIFALFGFYYLTKNPKKKFIVIIFASSVLSLSILKIFDRNDFILWAPMSLVIVHGISAFKRKQKHIKNIYYAFFLVFTLIQLIRIFI